MQEMRLHLRQGVERCLRYAFDYARIRQDDRARASSPWWARPTCSPTLDLWWRAFNEIGERTIPNIKREYCHVDATCMWFVKNPEWFDVIVTDNMFGDIITDLGAMIQGGMGVAAGGNINPGRRQHVRAHRRLGAPSTPGRTSSTRWPPSAPCR